MSQDLIEIPTIFHCSSLDQLINLVFPNGYSADDVGERAILAPTDAMIDAVNDKILAHLEGDLKTYVSVDEFNRQDDDTLNVPADLLHSINIPALAPHELQLKVGAIVMLLRNLDVQNGKCNGARMKVTRTFDRVPTRIGSEQR
ncbi:hypothetical protein NQ317_011137 [Molorchus minor]|uniref:DNA helicase Pif1-like 2B domain-containing protein n=1 Tax=Molorchus minor TaxID=1323400 RepID=A0ABQ9ISB7_9CUCU|nr:hypothetical protein NQ317_011137 [Molorchus minor]